MRRALTIARREWLEQRREPAMLVVVGALLALVSGLVVVAVGSLEWIGADPRRVELLEELTGAGPAPWTAAALGLFDFLVFTQFLGIAAVGSGHAVLHDRQCGTLTFLLLAPISRFELLLGKVLGALGWPLVLYVAIDGAASVVLAAMPSTAGVPGPRSAGFPIALLLGAPAWAAAVGAIGTVISAVARDVRTAQQAMWFVVFFATFGAGGLLTWALPAGPLAELVVAGLGGCTAAAVLSGGAAILARDLGR
jgi:ABC-type transport system involved in multi-copper enzyme maturation permease subunit